MPAKNEEPRCVVGVVVGVRRNSDDERMEELCQSFPPPLRRNCMVDIIMMVWYWWNDSKVSNKVKKRRFPRTTISFFRCVC